MPKQAQMKALSGMRKSMSGGGSLSSKMQGLQAQHDSESKPAYGLSVTKGVGIKPKAPGKATAAARMKAMPARKIY
jgi:hypothetical protein